jgi:hypothetical protein
MKNDISGATNAKMIKTDQYEASTSNNNKKVQKDQIVKSK